MIDRVELRKGFTLGSAFIVGLSAFSVLGFAWGLTPNCTDKPSTPAIANPGFESATERWSIHIYGAKPGVASDTETKHEGKSSLRISASEPTDTALGQELRVRPSQLYRLTGWVRTRGLDPREASVYGTFQVQKPGGKGVIVGGANHRT